MKIRNSQIGLKVLLVLIIATSCNFSSILPVEAKNSNKVFRDYKNDVEFSLTDDYKIIRDDEKMYGFENSKFKIIYSVVDNGQITDLLEFSDFDSVTDSRVIATVNNIGFNALLADVTVSSNDFSKYAEFEAKLGESIAYKNIFYKNDKFYNFVIAGRDKKSQNLKQYKQELVKIEDSISALVKTDISGDKEKNYEFIDAQYVNEQVEKHYNEESVLENDVQQAENLENIGIETENDDTDANLEVLNSENAIKEYLKDVLDKGIRVNKVVAMLVLGTLLAILLLRKFVVIYEHNFFIKYMAGAIAGYFAYRIYENFYYSMDYELNTTILAICVVLVLVLIYFPYRRKKTRNEKLKDSIDARNLEIAMKSIDKK